MKNKTTFSIKNSKEATPPWLVNLTALLGVITLAMPELITSLPGTVSAEVRDWLDWILKALTAISGTAAVFAKQSPANAKNDLVGPRPGDRNKEK